MTGVPEPTSSLAVFASHMAYVGLHPHADHGMLTITDIQVHHPARWGSGEGAIVYFVDDRGSLNQLNLQRHHLDKMLAAFTHPCYTHPVPGDPQPLWFVHIGDEVAHRLAHHTPVGTVTAIYLESVELSTGDQVPVADLVLLRRAES